MIRVHLRSRFGRRLFLSFLLASLLPILALAAFAYHEMQKQLVDSVQRGLREDSKNFGMEIVSELGWRIELMRNAEAANAFNRLSGFTWMGLADDAEAPPLRPQELDALAKHGAALRLTGSAQLLLMARSSDGRRTIVGRLDPGGLWQREVVNMPYCIFDLQHVPLYCTEGLTPPRRAADEARHRMRAVDVAGERFLGTFWEGRLDGLFGQGGFEVFMTAPEAMLSAPLTRLRLGFAAMIVLAIALAVGLSANQIRRQTAPLDALTGGVRRLASGDLDTVVDVPGEDEFAMLGSTFNAMSGRLRSKFRMLGLMAELDQAVLASAERGLITRTILDRVLEAIPCDGAGVLTLRADGAVDYLRASGPGEKSDLLPHRVPADVVARMRQQSGRDWVEVDDDLDSRLYGESPQPGRKALVFPVRTHDRVEGGLLLALRGGAETDDELVSSGRALADRMSVADSSIAWEARLYRQSHYDALTGLPNRMLLRDRVERACARARRDGLCAALLLINFDDFKSINEALGYQAGDQFLVEAARRIEGLARPNDTVARLTADEFVLVVPDVKPAEWMSLVHVLAERLTAALAEPVALDGQEVVSAASAGIAVCPDNAEDFDGLLKLSDLALQEAKRSGRGSVHFYAQSMNRVVSERFELSQALRRAIQNDELLLHYQPKVDAVDERIVGAEALVRWRSPSRGLVSPGVFLPLIGEMGLDGWLADFVIDRACAQMKAWDARGLPAIPVSVNIAPAELAAPDFCERVLSALARYDLPCERLELEILESAEVGEGSAVRDALTRLRARKVRIALDDFGTGYSSLVYLTELPADVLKLDRAFIRTMVGDVRQQSIVEQVIALARSLHFKVVAEGVEEAAQHALLRRMGCDQIQGFLFSKPLPAEEFAERLSGDVQRAAAGVAGSAV